MVNFKFKIMQEDDLENVLSTEMDSHVTPWKMNNFLDCLTAQYWNYVFVDTQLPYKLLGHCVVMPGFEEAHLLNITVHPNYRRMGIASNALEALEVSCKERSFQRLLLEVRKSNLGALKLYYQLGYEQIGIRKGYYPLPQGENMSAREDAIVMRKNLFVEC